MAPGATFATRWLHGHQPISNRQVVLGFPHPAGRNRPGGSAFFSPVCWTCTDTERFLISEYEIISPGCTGTSAFARGATFAARWLHGHQPISNRQVGLGFPHPAGRYRHGGSAFCSPVCWTCKDMEGFLIRKYEIIPGCTGTSALVRETTFAARWLHGRQLKAITQWCWGFHSLPGGIDLGDMRFLPLFVGLEEIWKDF